MLSGFANGYMDCSYGNSDTSNRVMFEYHSFSIIICCAVAPMLLFNRNLFRFYTPLAKIVNLSLILQVLEDVCYFVYHPYVENRGNCTAIVLGRVYSVTVMFGELHQVYLLANLLGMGSFNFRFGSVSFSIDSMLKLATILVIISLMHSTVTQHSFIITSNLWSIFVSALQIYFIKVSKVHQDSVTAILPATSSSVRMFDKLAKIELFPATICFVERVCDLMGIKLFAHFESVTLVLDVLTDLLFYLKVILIKENADVSLEVVNV